MSGIRERDLLYARLEEVLGAEPADILMRNLPGDLDPATRSDLDEVGSVLGLRIDGLEVRMDRLEGHMDRFDERLHDLHGALREQTRTFVIASMGTMVALVGVAFAAAATI